MIVAYLKPTNYCNVGCEHCYLSEETRANKEKMSEETLRNSSRLLLDMKMSKKEPVRVIWHGGEPLIMPADWFRQAGAILDDILGEHSESIQTSLIPWKDSFVDIVHKRWGGHVGSSVDFGTRKLKGSSEAYLDLWMSKVERVRQHGIKVVPGCVPSKNELGKAKQIIHWMAERGFHKFNIEKFNSFGQKNAEQPSNLEHSLFLIEMFDEIMNMMKSGSPPPVVRTIAAAIGGVLHCTPGDRWGGSCQSGYVVIEPDGSTNTCPDKTSFEKPFSNASGGYAAFSASKQRRNWIRVQEISHRKNHCLSCENNVWCRSGCPITPNGKSDGEDECSGFRIFLNHVREFVSTGTGHELAERYRIASF